MNFTYTGFSPKGLSSDEISKILGSNKPAHYKLEYFDVSAVGSVPRDILAYGNADWEDLPITNWPAEVKSPFGCFPVLHIFPDGASSSQSFRISESIVLEHYLASKFNLLGKNLWEEQQIRMFYSNNLYLRERFTMRVTWNYKEVMDRAMSKFLTAFLPQWIETHSKYLKENGSNGYYVGDQLSLADIQLANNFDHFAILKDGHKIIEAVKKHPEIWKVKETVDAEPRLQKWRQSEGYKNHIEMSKMRYAETGIASTCRAKVASWVQSLASPSQTHASGMLILIGLLAAATTATTTDAQSVHEPVHPNTPGSGAGASKPRTGAAAPGQKPTEAKESTNQEILYYVAMGMLVSQGLIRLFTYISSRREAAALAAAKKNDDLSSNKKSRKKSGLSLNAFEDLDEESIKKRKADLATLGEKAELLGSDTEDEDYEESDEEESEDEDEDEEEDESEEEEEEEVGEESESEGEIERRRRVLIAGDAEIEE
ncbi:hypothetical protein BGZ83_010498 [Gryganskiella cystojenkinii]|nr:hypothetical protein BGZ83_010498 [Gryganskiella cystojenkinii]